MNLSLYFSIFGGYIYEATENEEKVLDAFQIPLLERPDSSCKKCHGRFYDGYNATQKHFIICNKCSKKYIDGKKILEKKYGKSTKNN
jgi:hypothetical protein